MTRKRKAIMAIALALVMAVGVIFPIGLNQVKAIDPTITVSFGNGTVQGAAPDQTVTYNVGGTDVVATVTSAIDTGSNNIATISVGGNVLSGITIGNTYNSETMEIKLSGADNFTTTLSWDGTQLKKTSDGGFPDGTLTFSIEPKGGGGEDPEQQGDYIFDPTGDSVYFVWFEGSSVFSHEIQDVVGVDNRTNYATLASITDGTTGTAYSMSNDNYLFCWKAVRNGDQVTSLADYLTSEAFATAADKTEALKEAGFAIDPAISESEAKTASTIVTNGDREFRLVIYNEATYEGIRFSQNEDDYTYFPSFWDGGLYTGLLDVSGTTSENPAEYNAFVIEPTIKFTMDDKSNSPITSLEAMNVPSGSVMVSKVGDGFNIEFASHFFDNVVFRATSANGTYYIKINRATFNIWSEFIPTESNGSVIANFYYKDSESHNDYDVYATITNTDGSKSLQKLNATGVIEESGDKHTELEINGGKGLKRSTFVVSVPRSGVSSVSFNVTKAGAMSSNTYGGSYAGSNNGTTYDLSTRKTIY